MTEVIWQKIYSMLISYPPARTVEVFTTNVMDHQVSLRILILLQQRFPDAEINFDLEDCDRILRVKGLDVDVPGVCEAMRELGFCCSPL